MFNNLTFCRFSEISACGPSPISLSKHILFWNLYLCRPEKKKKKQSSSEKKSEHGIARMDQVHWKSLLVVLQFLWW